MDKKLDEALRQALAPCEEADFWLNQKILNRAAGLAENKEDIKEEKNGACLQQLSPQQCCAPAP